MNTLYFWTTTARVGTKLYPAVALFDGPGEDSKEIGLIYAYDEKDLDRIVNRLERCVSLED